VTIKQRAATLQLLQALLTPDLMLSASQALVPMLSVSSDATAGALAPQQLDFEEQQASQVASKSPAGQEVDSTKSGPGLDQEQRSLDATALQELRHTLLSRLLGAVPLVLKSAVTSTTFLAECGQQVGPQESTASASDPSVQSATDTDAQTDAEAQIASENQVGQQESEVVVIDGDAMHALLGLLLHVAGECGSQGMEALLALPGALAVVMPDLLASPQVNSSHL